MSTVSKPAAGHKPQAWPGGRWVLGLPPSPAEQLGTLAASFRASGDELGLYVAELLEQSARDARFVKAGTFDDIADRLEALEADRQHKRVDRGVSLAAPGPEAFR